MDIIVITLLEEECFIKYPNTSKWFKKNSTAPRFSTHFSVFGYTDKTHFLVFDILPHDCTTFPFQNDVRMEELLY